MANSRSKREKTATARNRVLKFVRKHGTITNRQARKAGRWAQAWYHLRTMEKEGYLISTGFNVWEPKRRKGRPVEYGSD